MAIKKVYWTFRHTYYNKWEWRYSPSYRLDQQYKDYKDAGLTKTLDNEIPDSRYTAEVATWIKKQTRFIVWEYNDTYINPVDFSNNIANVWAEFQIQMFSTPADAIIWIKANTDLVEDTTTPWKFEIYPAWTDMNGNPTPAKYLIIA